MSIAVGNATPVKIAAASTERHLVSVHNTGANPVTLGKSSTLTATTGYVVAAAGTQQVDLSPGEELYAICGAGLTSTVDEL